MSRRCKTCRSGVWVVGGRMACPTCEPGVTALVPRTPKHRRGPLRRDELLATEASTTTPSTGLSVLSNEPDLGGHVPA